jgi:hypothetical protein
MAVVAASAARPVRQYIHRRRIRCGVGGGYCSTGPQGGEPGGATLTSLWLTNSPNPSSESSRPKPELLVPPNGTSGAVHAGWFTKTMPLSICAAMARPRSRLPVDTDAPSPKRVALASLIASSSESTM